jgi:hypothetical protein
MRKINSFLTCLAVTATMLWSVSVSAQPTTEILTVTGKDWRYYQAGNEPAPSGSITWRTNTYNDTSWQSGFGVFAYEDSGAYPINTVLDRTVGGVSGGTQNITYYFRTHFNFPTNPAGVILYFTNYVDDGLILYLNGVRLYDIRVPTTTPTWGTLAGGTPAEATAELMTFINSPLLRQGDNVLAVELHDSSATSTDVAFGLGLAYSIMDRVVITEQPQSLVDAVAFDVLALSVEAAGTQPRYWWFRNNAFLANQTNATLQFNNIQLANAGTYHVVVSNTVSGARSSNAVVRVIPDTFGPRLVSACVQLGDTNRLLLQFNENILGGAASNPLSGANTNNYWITVIGQTNRLMATQAAVGAANRQVRLTLHTNFNFNTNYMLCISNIMDVRSNTIAWNSCMPVCFEVTTNNFGYASAWFYNEWAEPLDNTNWTALSYVEDPSRWYETAGAFAVEQSGVINPPCTFVSWTMSLGPNAYYFRKKFVVTTNILAFTNVTATIGSVLDDGAVFYLNGREIFRKNMPLGPITYDSRAPAAGTPDVCNVDNIPVGHLLQRTNILAVELHQNGDAVTGADRRAAFDASFSLIYEKYPPFTQPSRTNVFIRTTNHSPTQVSVYFTNGFGYAIQTKTNLLDPWQEVQPMTNRIIAPKSDKQRFYRLRKSH